MNCPDSGMLRAYWDRELTNAEHAEIQEHLASCEPCTAFFERMANQAAQIGRLLQGPAEGSLDATVAYSRYRQKFGARVEGRMDILKGVLPFGNRPLWSSLAALVLVLLFSFSPAQTWAQRVLQMLRAQKVAVVPVDFSAITATSDDSRKLMADLISDDVIVTMNPGKPVSVADIHAASQMAGFPIRTLDGAGSPTNIQVTNEGAFQATLDRDRMQAILDQAGRSDVQIPPSVDGSTVAVYIPKIVRVQYGNCTMPSDGSCIHFMQVRTPTVSVPPTLNIAALAEAGLELAGMSAAEAHSFAQTVDWSSTLVIPMPRNGSSNESVAVDGVTGTLLEQAPHENSRGRYLLVWMKNGMIYSVDGTGDSSAALAAVASLGS